MNGTDGTQNSIFRCLFSIGTKCCFLQEKGVKTYKNTIKTLGSLYATFAGCVGGVRRPDEVDFRGFSKNPRFVTDLSQSAVDPQESDHV